MGCDAVVKKNLEFSLAVIFNSVPFIIESTNHY
jgi:hypothetical protein